MIYIAAITEAPTPVELTVPLAVGSAATSTNLTLRIANAITHASYDVEATLSHVYAYKVAITATFADILPTGQYTFDLLSGSTSLSRGLLQIGDMQPNTSSYNTEKQTIVYEG